MRPTYTMDVIAEDAGYRLYEVVRDGATVQSDYRFYVVRYNEARYQVYTAISGDAPRDGGTWCSSITPRGVMYVADPRTRATARRWFRRLVTEAKEEEAF